MTVKIHCIFSPGFVEDSSRLQLSTRHLSFWWRPILEIYFEGPVDVRGHLICDKQHLLSSAILQSTASTIWPKAVGDNWKLKIANFAHTSLGGYYFRYLKKKGCNLKKKSDSVSADLWPRSVWAHNTIARRCPIRRYKLFLFTRFKAFKSLKNANTKIISFVWNESIEEE